MRWLVVIVVVMVVEGGRGEVQQKEGDTRHHFDDVPVSHGINAQDYCNPVLFNLGAYIQNQGGSAFILDGPAKTLESIKTTSGKSTSSVTLSDMTITGLQDFRRYHAGNITDAKVGCSIQFRVLDVEVHHYKADIPRYGRVRYRSSWGSINAKVNLVLNFDVLRGDNDQLSVITSAKTEILDDEFSFTKPRHLWRNIGMFRDILQDALETALTDTLDKFLPEALAPIVDKLEVDE